MKKAKNEEKPEKPIGDMTLLEFKEFCRRLIAEGKTIDQISAEIRKRATPESIANLEQLGPMSMVVIT